MQPLGRAREAARLGHGNQRTDIAKIQIHYVL
jgi:hypothetical protein